MAELTCTVDPDGAGDYDSLNAAEAVEQQDLTDGDGDTWVCTCTSSGGTADTTAVLFNGWTAAAANYIEIKAATGHEAVKTGIDTSRYRLAVSDDECCYVFEKYVRFTNLQILPNYSSASTYGIRGGSGVGTGEYRVSGCYINGSGGAGGTIQGIASGDADIVWKIWNTIVANAGTNDSNNRGISLSAAATTSVVYNCIIYNAYQAIRGDGSGTTAKNVVSFNNSDDFNSVATVDYCASDDDDGTNNVAESGGGAAWPDDFVDAENGDFTLKATSNLVGAGVDLSGLGLFSTDIDGDTYANPPSLGVDEIVATGGPRARALVGPFGGPLGGVA